MCTKHIKNLRETPLKKKKHEEHVNHERWLVSYADFITLLFAFFVIMYAISKSDVQKFQKAAESLRSALSGDFVNLQGNSGGKTLDQFDERVARGGKVLDLPVGRTNELRAEKEDGLLKVARILEESLSFELGTLADAEKMQMVPDEKGLLLRIAAKDFYDAGAVQVRSDALHLLDQMAKALQATNNPIRIAGHTDDSGDARKNWEVSTSRAVWMTQYLIERHKLDPTRFEVSGFAHYRPLAPNTSEKNRNKNRRVEILILK